MEISILGKNIKRIREEKGWSAYKLYKKAGVGSATISGIESGTRQSLNSDTIKKIAKALSVTTDSLYSKDGETEYIVTDLSDTIDYIFKSQELTIDDEEMTQLEKEKIKILIEAGINTIKLERKVKRENEPKLYFDDDFDDNKKE